LVFDASKMFLVGEVSHRIRRDRRRRLFGHATEQNELGVGFDTGFVMGAERMGISSLRHRQSQRYHVNRDTRGVVFPLDRKFPALSSFW
jgi:hypothetical protein